MSYRTSIGFLTLQGWLSARHKAEADRAAQRRPRTPEILSAWPGAPLLEPEGGS